ncbi:CMGC/SRPK protein kinase [Polytolypa hystricis UAMH7299]|uniref:non-specific serine/threonine protein kinase n=1 Tax=Polytolypa hystricis (strain UAMH7299) TaxID=1447883 RepID=A0A2B7WQU2_POLH7|nr:CMGC/SRPK protein kinase [Polytolypa hystricis UAMH7299]
MARARYNESEQFITLKINNCNSHGANRERDIEKHIAQKNPSHRGHEIIRTCVESFEIAGPEGSHLCLAYEPMREPLWLLQRRFTDWSLPLPIVKAYVLMLLAGLDYLHSECKVVHTDLKLENILVTFEDQEVIEDFVKVQADLPMQYKTDPTSRNIYRRHNDFSPLKRLQNLPKIADFGLAARLDNREDIGIYPIQPGHYCSPEVILGCGWTFSTDIWNLGVLVWDLVERTELFRCVHDSQSCYDGKAHLAEMIALLGPPPKELLARSNAMQQYKWSNPIKNVEGKLSKKVIMVTTYITAKFLLLILLCFLHDNLIPTRQLNDTLPSSNEKERAEILSFVSQILTWLPEERKTARGLMEHPFLSLE